MVLAGCRRGGEGLEDERVSADRPVRAGGQGAGWRRRRGGGEAATAAAGARDRTGGGGGGRPVAAAGGGSHHPPALPSAAPPLPAPARTPLRAKTPADFNWERKRVPFESHYFAKNSPSSRRRGPSRQESLSALLTLRAILDARARQIAKELAALNQLDGAPVQHPPGRQPRPRSERCKIHVDDLAAAEAALRAELADIAAMELEAAAAVKAKEVEAEAGKEMANGVEVAEKESGGDGGEAAATKPAEEAAAAPAVPAPAAPAAPAAASEPPIAAAAPAPASAAAEPVPMATDG